MCGKLYVRFVWITHSDELIEYNEESPDDIGDSDNDDDTIEEDTLKHIYFNQKYDPYQCLMFKKE